MTFPLAGNNSESLGQVIDRWQAEPFSYGKDCCQFAGECIEALTGKNPMSGFRYEDEFEARSIIDRHGSLKNAIINTLGDPIPVNETTDGDVILVHLKSEQIVGVRYKERIIVRTEMGCTDWPLRYGSTAWSHKWVS